MGQLTVQMSHWTNKVFCIIPPVACQHIDRQSCYSHSRLSFTLSLSSASNKIQQGQPHFSFVAMIDKAPKTERRYGIPVGYIGTAGVQALLNKSRATIWRMVNDGRLPQPLQDGCIKIWDRKEILRWIDNAKFCRKRWKIHRRVSQNGWQWISPRRRRADSVFIMWFGLAGLG